MKIKALLLIYFMIVCSIAWGNETQTTSSAFLPTAIEALNGRDSDGNLIEGNASLLAVNAYDNYVSAKSTDNAADRSIYYGNAIRDINAALKKEPHNSDYLIIASQIYRAKGGLSYAKDYFRRSEAIILEKLAKNPDDIIANLDYATMCYAGDVRYWPEYNEYTKKAKEYAKKVIELSKQKTSSENIKSQYLRCRAYAMLLLGDNKKCEELLLQRTGKDADAIDKTDFTSAELSDYNFYRFCLVENAWLWQVSEESQPKEYLMYCFADGSKYMYDEFTNPWNLVDDKF